MKSGAKTAMPTSVSRALAKLGDDINIARRKRGLSVAHTTEAAGISAGTLRRIEKGDPATSIGSVAMVLLALGEHKRLEAIMDMASDTSGLIIDLKRLPKRVTNRSSKKVEM